MSEKQILVVLTTCLATGLGSFGVGDSFPCQSKEEADRMVEAGQATHPCTEHVSKAEFNALQLVNKGLLTELAAANEKLSLPGELTDEVKEKISGLELALASANEKLKQPTTLPVEVEDQINQLTTALTSANKEKEELEKNLEAASKNLIASNKKLKSAETKLKAK
jgi:chromosome segregation ATPase